MTHEVFDRLWRGHKEGISMSRDEAYEWLREKTGLAEEECHIAQFDASTCKRVRKWARKELKRRARARCKINRRKDRG